MDIDYRSLYVEDYFGHQEGAASFPEQFPEAFARIVRDVRGGAVLDVGAGNNELIRRLGAHGLGGFSLDLRGDEARSVLAFDLTKFDAGLCASVRDRVAGAHPGGPHVTCCLDVLEHLDRKDLATAIWNLRELSAEWLLLSVSTRPSSRYNLYHATIMPKRSWRALLDAAGFEVADHPRLADLASRRDYPDDENCWSVNQWRRVDPFRDAFDPESYYLLLRRRPEAVGRSDFDATAARLLGRGDGASAAKVTLDPGTHLVFLLGHYQDFLQYIPYWEALPRDSFTVLAPDDAFHVIGPRREKAIEAWMRGRGLRVRRVHSVREFDWRDLPGQRRALIASSDSTGSASHLLCSAFVLEARVQGVPTFQIQHGIWPHASFAGPIRFYADTVLAWSDEYRDGFLRAGVEGPSQGEFAVAGCAKFDDYAAAQPIELADLLGEWVEPYRHRVLAATNLHWPLHHRGAEVMPRLVETARSMPDTLFVCKLHPVHDLDASTDRDRPANLLILDEFACLFAGLKTSQLVRACDAVVGTLSTVALEAALARRPFAILETGNPNRYEHVTPVPIADMASAVGRMLASGPCAEDERFRDHYYDAANLGRSLGKVLGAVEERLSRPATAPALVPLEAVRAFAATFSDYVFALQPRRFTVLDRAVEEGKLRIAELEATLRQAEEALSALGRSASEGQALIERQRVGLDLACGELEALRGRLAALDSAPALRADPGHRPLGRVPRLASALRTLLRRR